jgi:acetolactate synthase-1/2/3 large subunit
MLNLQELQTIVHHKLPIKVFVLNNNGYLAIKNTQDGFLEGRRYGVGWPDLSFPKVDRVAYAFGIPYVCSQDQDVIKRLLLSYGPYICEVLVPEDQKMVRQGYRKEGERFVPMDLSEMVY